MDPFSFFLFNNDVFEYLKNGSASKFFFTLNQGYKVGGGTVQG